MQHIDPTDAIQNSSKPPHTLTALGINHSGANAAPSSAPVPASLPASPQPPRSRPEDEPPTFPANGNAPVDKGATVACVPSPKLPMGRGPSLPGSPKFTSLPVPQVLQTPRYPIDNAVAWGHGVNWTPLAQIPAQPDGKSTEAWYQSQPHAWYPSALDVNVNQAHHIYNPAPMRAPNSRLRSADDPIVKVTNPTTKAGPESSLNPRHTSSFTKTTHNFALPEELRHDHPCQSFSSPVS